MQEAVQRYDGGGSHSMHRRQPRPGEDCRIPALRFWAPEMSQGGGGSFRPRRLLPVHGRQYFSRELGLSDTGLNPWDPSFKLVVPSKEVEDVFGTSKNPVCLTAAQNITPMFLRELSNNVFRKEGCKYVSLAFARGAIATHRGLQVDWATFAFLGQFKGRYGRARLNRFRREQQGDSTAGAVAVAENRIRIIEELQGRLRRLRRKQSRIEDMLLVLEKQRTGHGAVQSPTRMGMMDHTPSHKGELVEELSKLVAHQKDLQQDFFKHLCCNTKSSDGGTNSASLQALALTDFVDVKPFATRDHPLLAVEDQPTCLLEGPIEDEADRNCKAKFMALAEMLFGGSTAKEKQGFTPPAGMKPRWRRL